MTTTSTPIHVQVPLSTAYEWMKTDPSQRVEKLSEYFGVALSQETEIAHIYDGVIEENGSKKLGTIKGFPVMTGQFKVSTTKTARILDYLLSMTELKVWVKILNSGYAEAVEAKAIAEAAEAKAIATDTADKDKSYEAGYKQAISDVIEKFRGYNRIIRGYSIVHGHNSLGCKDSDKNISDAQSSAEAIDIYLDQAKEQLETLTSELEKAQEEIDEVLSESANFYEFLNDKSLEQILKKD